MHLTSALLTSVPGILHGFGTAMESIPRSFRQAWEEAHPSWKQVHGTAIAEVNGPNQQCGEVDAMITRAEGIPIAAMTADCVPILLSRTDGKAVASIHAGWRGTRAHITHALVEKLESQGEKPADWVAAIGPAIGPCCYEVSEDLAADFAREFSNLGPNVAVPRHRILDLPAINAGELKQLGLQKVDIIRACTKCAAGPYAPFFHSFRREGGNARQWSLIMRGTMRGTMRGIRKSES